MKTTFLVTLLLFCFSLQLLGQTHPLVGTWKAVSIKGTDPDGKQLSMDGSQFVETKIITPTHYALITHMKSGDSLVFDKAIAGTVRVEGNKYYETPQYFSGEGFDKAKTDFTYTLEGDRFIQKGIITEGDKVFKLDELVFEKVKAPTQNNPAVGVWNQVSSKGVAPNGEKWSHTNATHIRFLIITPTHWMVLSTKENKFENARGGSYTMQGDKMLPKVELASLPDDGTATVELTQRMEAGKLHSAGIVKLADGKSFTMDDVYEKVSPKTIKTPKQ